MGPLPPPVGGDTVTTLNLARSGYWQEAGIDVVTVDTSGGGEVKLPGRRLSITDAFRALRVITSVSVKLPGADALLLWANSRFLCTAGLVMILLAGLFGKPVAAKVFGAFLGERIKGMSPVRRKWTISVLKRCGLVLPQTGALMDELVQGLGLGASQVMLFPNYVKDAYFSAAVREKGKDTGDDHPGGFVRLIFLGQIKNDKGIFDIIEAVGGEDFCSCDFYGPVADPDSERFKREVARYANIRYRGITPPENVPSILAEHDALLLPTYHVGEGYPAVILQAFASRVTVIASDWLSISDMMGDGERGFLVPVKDAKALAEAVRRLATESETVAELRENAYEYAKRFSEESIVGGSLIPGLIDMIESNKG